MKKDIKLQFVKSFYFSEGGNLLTVIIIKESFLIDGL